MARKTNYAFERNAKAAAKAAKREAKREARAAARAEKTRKAAVDDSDGEELDSHDGDEQASPPTES